MTPKKESRLCHVTSCVRVLIYTVIRFTARLIDLPDTRQNITWCQKWDFKKWLTQMILTDCRSV